MVAGMGLACAPLAPLPQSAPVAPPPAAPATPPPVVTVYVPQLEPVDVAARHVLAYQERLLQLSPGDLAQEVARLGDGSASPQAAMDLALALGYTRGPGDLQRAQALLDQVLRNGSPQAQPWHSLAKLLQARYAEQRRAEEQTERLNAQLRDAQRDNQRKIDQLNEKLEALKNIERSLNSRPQPGPPQLPAPSAPAIRPAQ
jgi:hypothetical protein